MHSRRKIQKERWRIQMKGTYKAVEVSAPGTLRIVERQVSEPGAGQVRIRVEACGICHTDAATVTGTYPGLKLPRVPGHEVVGRTISSLGRRRGIGMRFCRAYRGGHLDGRRTLGRTVARMCCDRPE